MQKDRSTTQTAVASPTEALLRAAREVSQVAPNPVETRSSRSSGRSIATSSRPSRRCGEPTEGVTYDKFSGKLRANRQQLISRYACKSVKFQVYVKDGKAALKATPVTT